MGIRLSLIVLIFLGLSIPACAQSKSDLTGKDAPKIKFELEQFDFGEIVEGMLVKHVFNFINSGGDTLRIKRVDPG
jgi:hypothetical protein